MARYVIAALVSALLGLVDLPPGQVAGLLSWRKRTSAWIAPVYLAVTGAAGASAVALASLGADAAPEQQHGLLSAALLGAAGHGGMRATVRGRAAAGDQAAVASALERTRGWLEAVLRTSAAAEVLPVLCGLADPDLLDLAADLANPALEAPSTQRAKELGILLAAAAALREATGEARDDARRALRPALRAEVVRQGATRGRVTGARRRARPRKTGRGNR